MDAGLDPPNRIGGKPESFVGLEALDRLHQADIALRDHFGNGQDEGCRLPLNIGFLPLPVDPISKAMTHPLRSTGITPLQHYYGAVRPSPAHRYFRPRGWSPFV